MFKIECDGELEIELDTWEEVKAYFRSRAEEMHGDGESVNFDDYVIYKEVSFTYESDVKFKMRKVKGG